MDGGDGDARPFSYLSREDGSIVIRYHEAPVVLLRGKSALRFASRIDRADATGAQLLMARAAASKPRSRPPAR